MRIRETPLENWLASHQTRSSWQPIGKSALCAMTGLSSDVDHVTRVVQNHVQQHRAVYDVATPPLTKWLADTVRGAAKWEGGRPYGLQALLVTSNTNHDPSVFTVDPSGAWRHWGSGCTCIGRNAEDIRQELYDQLKETEEPANLNPLLALKVALKSLLKATHAASVNQENDDYDAILMWVDPSDCSQCRVASIDPDTTKACRDEIWEMISTKQSS
jgi:20S proteasome alpha/beta subunit